MDGGKEGKGAPEEKVKKLRAHRGGGPQWLDENGGLPGQ